jgi:hypothetical protein
MRGLPLEPSAVEPPCTLGPPGATLGQCWFDRWSNLKDGFSTTVPSSFALDGGGGNGGGAGHSATQAGPPMQGGGIGGGFRWWCHSRWRRSPDSEPTKLYSNYSPVFPGPAFSESRLPGLNHEVVQPRKLRLLLGPAFHGIITAAKAAAAAAVAVAAVAVAAAAACWPDQLWQSQADRVSRVERSALEAPAPGLTSWAGRGSAASAPPGPARLPAN